MPALFVGHGSPMNAIEDNAFTHGWQSAAQAIAKPKAILCVSAHWETRGVGVCSAALPETIHDFGGFPQALFDVRYPAPGDPPLAQRVVALVKSLQIQATTQWGLDHGDATRIGARCTACTGIDSRPVVACPHIAGHQPESFARNPTSTHCPRWIVDGSLHSVPICAQPAIAGTVAKSASALMIGR